MITGDVNSPSWAKTSPIDEEAHVVIQHDDEAAVAVVRSNAAHGKNPSCALRTAQLLALGAHSALIFLLLLGTIVMIGTGNVPTYHYTNGNGQEEEGNALQSVGFLIVVDIILMSIVGPAIFGTWKCKACLVWPAIIMELVLCVTALFMTSWTAFLIYFLILLPNAFFVWQVRRA